MMRVGPFRLSLTELFLNLLSRQFASDAWVNKNLLVHAGKVVAIEVGSMRTVVQLYKRAEKIHLMRLPKEYSEVHATLKVAVNDLQKLLQPEQRISAVHIQGDAAFMQALAETIKYHQFDWQSLLQGFLGPLFTARIEQLLHVSKDKVFTLLNQLLENITWVISQENSLVVTQTQQNTTAENLLRLQGKLQQVEQKMTMLEANAKRISS